MISEGKKRIWKEYQKEIEVNRFYYFRSCVRQNFYPAAEQAFLTILRDILGKEVYDNRGNTTCTGIGYHCDIIPFETIMTVVARHFALMTEAGYNNFVISCVTSFGLYTEILETWKHFPETEERTREFLWKATRREFRLPDNIVHASDIIYKLRHQIAARCRYMLTDIRTGKPLRVVEHIGCHYARMFPHKGVGGAEYPYVLAGLVESLGGEVLDYPERRHCCGFGFRQYVVRSNRGYSLSCSKKKFDSMAPFKPDLIVANCPGCTYFLDRWQYVVSEMEGITYGEKGHGIPVLSYEELAGLALGLDPWDLGLQTHQVSSEPLLLKMGIPFDPSKKYLGAGGRYMGRPDRPHVLKVDLEGLETDPVRLSVNRHRMKVHPEQLCAGKPDHDPDEGRVSTEDKSL